MIASTRRMRSQQVSEPKFLRISNAMGRDIDAGRAKGRDIADFLPDAVAQEMLDASHSGPVHAENLVPISKAEARRRTTFDGESMPKFPATRRVIPAPYRRDRVVGGSHGKSWRTLIAGAIRVGDIITDLGLVVDRREVTAYATREHVAAGMAHSNLMYADVDGIPEGVEEEDLVAIEPGYFIIGAGGKGAIFRCNAEVKVFR